MVLGVGKGQVLGVPPFEAKDLAGAVQKWIGADGPAWDFERIRVDDHDVIVIIVDPPSGDMWTCRADGGEGLVDGGIYVRHDGETRQAKGDEVRLLIERAKPKGTAFEVAVAVEGVITAIRVDESAVTEFVVREAASLRDQAERGTRRGPYDFASLRMPDRRSRDQFLDQVAAWEKAGRETPLRGVIDCAGVLLDGSRLRLRNLTRTFLRDVRLDVLFEADVVAAEWERFDPTYPPDIVPNKPRDWGTDTVNLALAYSGLGVGTRARNLHGVVQIKRGSPAILTMHMDALRPEEEHVSDDDEAVLVMFSEAPSEPVRARWRVTAQDINDVLEGTLEVPVVTLDWRDAVQRMLNGDDV
jgi:hypothetical protein